MALNKMILFVVIMSMPFFGFSQVENERQYIETVNVIEHVSELSAINIVHEPNQSDELLGCKKVERISKDPMIQNKVINTKKSKDIISIKAYMKSLQMKRKETLMS